MTPEHNPGEPDLGHDDDAEHNPGEPVFDDPEAEEEAEEEE